MPVDQAVANWVRLAERDIGSARYIVEHDPDNALFLCQQAIEKALKGIVQRNTDDVPPRTHHLLRLARLAGLADQLDPDQLELLTVVGPYATITRYPPDGQAPTVRADAAEIVERSEEAVRWLLARLK